MQDSKRTATRDSLSGQPDPPASASARTRKRRLDFPIVCPPPPAYVAAQVFDPVLFDYRPIITSLAGGLALPPYEAAPLVDLVEARGEALARWRRLHRLDPAGFPEEKASLLAAAGEFRGRAVRALLAALRWAADDAPEALSAILSGPLYDGGSLLEEVENAVATVELDVEEIQSRLRLPRSRR